MGPASVVAFACWICKEQFKTNRDLKNHLVARPHERMRVLCPWCPSKDGRRDKTLRRMSDLKVHALENHKSVDISKFPGDFFSEANGFYFSLYPKDYVRIVNASSYRGESATLARGEILKWLENNRKPEKERHAWMKEWSDVRSESNKRPFTPEQDFTPDYEGGDSSSASKRMREYSPTRPQMKEWMVKNITFQGKGITVDIQGEKDNVYRLELKEGVQREPKIIASLLRRAEHSKEDLFFKVPSTWKDVKEDQKLKKDLASTSGIQVSNIQRVMIGQLTPVYTPSTITEKDCSNNSEGDSRPVPELGKEKEGLGKAVTEIEVVEADVEDKGVSQSDQSTMQETHVQMETEDVAAGKEQGSAAIQSGHINEEGDTLIPAGNVVGEESDVFGEGGDAINGQAVDSVCNGSVDIVGKGSGDANSKEGDIEEGKIPEAVEDEGPAGSIDIPSAVTSTQLEEPETRISSPAYSMTSPNHSLNAETPVKTTKATPNYNPAKSPLQSQTEVISSENSCGLSNAYLDFLQSSIPRSLPSPVLTTHVPTMKLEKDPRSQALHLLASGCMPLFPPAKRNWEGRTLQLPCCATINNMASYKLATDVSRPTFTSVGVCCHAISKRVTRESDSGPSGVACSITIC
ncbi:hypothetical protein FSP39_019996 [Pinctada imbricata]|uniref:C2H2-type domain-containing protein n=1 Tax=Pinctada imbricata TaxID=66713 RepID=A0AA88XGA4_PINIB|nr:hypothetical protein FSP39_019996 [Pinctada imbricata]